MPQKIKKYFFTIGNFLIGLVLLLTFALSKYQDYQIYRSELLQRQAELTSRQEYFKNLDYLQAELKKYEPEIKYEKKYYFSFFQFIKAMAKKPKII